MRTGCYFCKLIIAGLDRQHPNRPEVLVPNLLVYNPTANVDPSPAKRTRDVNDDQFSVCGVCHHCHNNGMSRQSARQPVTSRQSAVSCVDLQDRTSSDPQRFPDHDLLVHVSAESATDFPRVGP